MLWRRKLAILPLLIVLPLVVFLQKETPEPVYEASATVLLNRQSQGLSGVNDPTIWDPSRTIRTQSQLARLPEVADRVAKEADVPALDAATFLAHSSVSSSDTDNDLMVFYARWGDGDTAVKLANLYATHYIAFRRELDTKALQEATRLVAEQFDQLRSQGVEPTSTVYQALIGRQQQLEAAETLQASNALLVREAKGAGAIGTPGNRNLFIAVGLALVLGLGLAFLFETLDTRVRSLDRLREALGLPLLAAVPAQNGFLRRPAKPVMLTDPESVAAEPYRMLRAGLGIAMGADSQLLMVTSAREREGKSTTAANLAIAMARAGQHVILADLDLYCPGLQRIFQAPAGVGMADVAAGRVELEDALRVLPLDTGPGRRGTELVLSTNGRSAKGSVALLTSGSKLEAPGEFVASEAFDVMLERLRDRADVVIIDSPPVLLSGDALVLSSKVDGLLVVARLNVVKEAEIREFAQLLETCPARALGLVVTGTSSAGAGYYYGYRNRESARAPSSSKAT